MLNMMDRKISIDDIENAVKKAGYEAIYVTEENKDDSKKEEWTKSQKGKK